MSDFFLPWGGDLDWTATGDIRSVTEIDYAVQRVTRRLLTNPAVRNVTGMIVQPGDNMFNQEYGKGFGKLIGRVSNGQLRIDAERLIRSALAEEPGVDQSVPAQVDFYTDQDNPQTIFVVAQFTVIQGKRAQVGFQL